MQFYWVFPLLWFAFSRWGAGVITLGLGLPIFFFGQWLSVRVHYDQPALLVFGLSYFLAGMVASIAVTQQGNPRKRSFLMLLSLGLVTLDRSYGRQIVLLPLLLVLMLWLARAEIGGRLPKAFHRILNSKPLHFASDASYCVYLFHNLFIAAAGWVIAAHPALQALPAHTRTISLLIFGSLASYAWAWLVHRWVEQPGIALGRRLLIRPR